MTNEPTVTLRASPALMGWAILADVEGYDRPVMVDFGIKTATRTETLIKRYQNDPVTIEACRKAAARWKADFERGLHGSAA